MKFETRKPEVILSDIETGLDIAERLDRPIIFASVDARWPNATQFKAYPSGQLLWAFDGENPFQADALFVFLDREFIRKASVP